MDLMFSDLNPVKQDDGPHPVCAIAYKDTFTERMDIFRAVLRIREFSERVLSLTEELLYMNAANYTVWQYRRECIKHLGKDYQEEFAFMDKFAKDNPKNYQIWYHRRAITELSGDASRELSFVNRVFELDAKNYHAWAHRQWVVKTFALWEGELEAVDSLLDADVRNNSAWNHRWFVMHEAPTPIGLDKSVPDSIDGEVQCTWERIAIAPENESPWNYLKGLCRHYTHIRAPMLERLHGMTATKESGSTKVNVFALDLIASLCELLAPACGGGARGDAHATMQLLQEAQDAYASLALHDSIRAKYWNKRQEETDCKMKALA